MTVLLIAGFRVGTGVARNSPRNLYIASSPQAYSAQGAERPERVGGSGEGISG